MGVNRTVFGVAIVRQKLLESSADLSYGCRWVGPSKVVSCGKGG